MTDLLQPAREKADLLYYGCAASDDFTMRSSGAATLSRSPRHRTATQPSAAEFAGLPIRSYR
jgi:hypothetical protein